MWKDAKAENRVGFQREREGKWEGDWAFAGRRPGESTWLQKNCSVLSESAEENEFHKLIIYFPLDQLLLLSRCVFIDYIKGMNAKKILAKIGYTSNVKKQKSFFSLTALFIACHTLFRQNDWRNVTYSLWLSSEIFLFSSYYLALTPSFHFAKVFSTKKNVLPECLSFYCFSSLCANLHDIIFNIYIRLSNILWQRFQVQAPTA